MSENAQIAEFTITKRLLKRAFFTALVVGTIINAINYADVILAGDMPTLWKMLLTYSVPFCVTIWGAYSAHK